MDCLIMVIFKLSMQGMIIKFLMKSHYFLFDRRSRGKVQWKGEWNGLDRFPGNG